MKRRRETDISAIFHRPFSTNRLMASRSIGWNLIRIRFIGGFGQIAGWTLRSFMTKNPFSPAQEAQIIRHMNNDHKDALRHYCKGEDAEMVGIDADGFDLLTSARKVRSVSRLRFARWMKHGRCFRLWQSGNGH